MPRASPPERPRPRETEHPSSELAGAGPPASSSMMELEEAPQPAIASCTQPLIASQRSSVHALPSSQLPHAVHAAAPGPEDVPAGHAEHVVAPAAEVVPGSHFVQVVAPATFVNDPAAHAVQVVFAVVVHAVAWKVPASQTLHALQRPPFRKNAAGQLPHWLAFGPEQAVQLASQLPQAVSADAVHAADGYLPAPHTLHAVHAPPLRYLPAEQLAHSVALGPVHVTQLALQAPQAVFAFAVHADTWYWLALQVLHATHWPPLRYLPAAQLVHWLAAGPEQVVHVGSHGDGGSAAAIVGTSSTRTNE